MKRDARLALLRSVAACTRPFLARRDSKGKWPERPRILLIRPDHLGDVLFITPALHDLRRLWPQAHITCLVGPWAARVLEGNPDLDQVLTCDFPWFNRRPRAGLLAPYRYLASYAQELGRQGFDASVNLRFDFWWGAALAHLASVPRRHGYDIPECRPFLTAPSPYVGMVVHQVVRNYGLVAALARDHGFSLEVPKAAGLANRLSFQVTAEDRAAAASLLEGAGLSHAGCLVAIHPGTGSPVKRWLPERFAAVADYLNRESGAGIVLTGNAAERPLADAISARMSRPSWVAAGKTNLGQLAALFQRCGLVIGVDSGPLHLAVALGVPTVHLFGPVEPAQFGPWGDPARHMIVQASMDCVPCNRLDYRMDELTAHPCMERISVQEVLEAARKVMA